MHTDIFVKVYIPLKVWFAIALIHPISTHFQARSDRLNSLCVTQYMANTLPLEGTNLLNFWSVTTSWAIAPTLRKEIAKLDTSSRIFVLVR